MMPNIDRKAIWKNALRLTLLSLGLKKQKHEPLKSIHKLADLHVIVNCSAAKNCMSTGYLLRPMGFGRGLQPKHQSQGWVQFVLWHKTLMQQHLQQKYCLMCSCLDWTETLWGRERVRELRVRAKWIRFVYWRTRRPGKLQEGWKRCPTVVPLPQNAHIARAQNTNVRM